MLFLLLAAEIVSATPCDGATQLEMNQCASEQRRAVEEELQRSITSYSSRLSKEQRRLFEHSQSAWKAYADAHCRFKLSNAVGGSAYSWAYAQCMQEQEQERLRTIKDLAHCEEGDLACPAP